MRENWGERTAKEIIAEQFPQLMNNYNPQVNDAQGISTELK